MNKQMMIIEENTGVPMLQGPEFDVYEWIESTETPLEYSGEGVPFDIENYLIDQVFNKSRNL